MKGGKFRHWRFFALIKNEDDYFEWKKFEIELDDPISAYGLETFFKRHKDDEIIYDVFVPEKRFWGITFNFKNKR